MMKFFIAIGAALVALPTVAAAQEPIHWAGKAIIETVSTECGSFGPTVGESHDATVLPLQVQVSPGPWSNNGSFIRVANDWEQMSININGNIVTNTSPQFAILTRIIRPGGAYQHQITVNRIAVAPASITPTTTNFKITITVTNFYGGPNCQVRLAIWLVKVPEEQQNARAGKKAGPFRALAE